MALDIPSYLLGKSKGGGSTPTLQSKNVTITENGDTTVTPDTGYDGLSGVNITTNVELDLSEYFEGSISNGTYSGGNISGIVKTFPSSITVSGTSLNYTFYGSTNLTSIPAIDTSNVTDMSYMCYDCQKLTSVALINTSRVTTMSNMFYKCILLTNIPQFDTSNVTNFSRMFSGCSALTTLPILNISKGQNLNNMFGGCTSLTDTSLDNILQMCINATSYNDEKTLNKLGISNTTVYPASRIEALPHYQDFIDAGWTIGY